jgi:predicted AAA+ superfamily ATPase
MQEIISLSERFGIQITFQKPNKQTYLGIVHHLAKEHGLEYDPVKLELEAERFVLQRGSRSARAAAQFIDSLMASKKD